MFFFLPHGVCCVLGVACAGASAASTVVGMLLQKEGLARDNKAIFRLGVLVFTIVKPGAQFVALFLAPVSLVAPLASVAILLNAVIVPWCRAETISRRDVWSGVMLVVACMGATSLGPHSTNTLSYTEICDLADKSRDVTLALSILTLLLALNLAVAQAHARRQLSLPSEPAAPRPFLGVVAAAFVPSAASALNNVAIKVLLHGLLSGPRLSLVAWAGALAFTAFLQVWSTTVGVQFFDMLVYVPIQVAEQILVTVAYGAIFFEEAPASPAGFFACIGAVALGVLLSQSSSTTGGDYHRIEDLEKNESQWSQEEKRTHLLMGG
mmetsp:Transcript_95271/g.188805  ORF Transcript_95271/g.188805 Transcript_95271/m.188805 type:complete len:323 (+) Transcript_95271:113-1081(+)